MGGVVGFLRLRLGVGWVVLIDSVGGIKGWGLEVVVES